MLELDQVREAIDRTANVVRALEAAFTSTQVRTNLAERIETEACMQERRLVDLLARERELMAPPQQVVTDVSGNGRHLVPAESPVRDVGELLKDPLAVILTEVAGLVRIAGPDHFPDDAIPREPVVECAMRIRDARDAICSASRAYARAVADVVAFARLTASACSIPVAVSTLEAFAAAVESGKHVGAAEISAREKGGANG